MSRADAEPEKEGLRLRARLRALYHGSSPVAVRFRLAVLIIDLIIIASRNRTASGEEPW